MDGEAASMTCQRQKTIAAFGTWDSPITAQMFSEGNAKAICEVKANNGGVFWVEEHILTGERGLFHRSFDEDDDQKTERWADGMSLQNSVHEYGGGSLCLQPDGSVIFSSFNGVFTAKSHTDEPRRVIDGKKNHLRFADISSNGKLAFCVMEDHSSGDHLNPENVLVSVDLTSNEFTTVARGCDFYACPRLSPDARQLVWMQWNHINMPWDETEIVLGDITTDGKIVNERVILSGIGRGVNYYNPTWSPNRNLLVVCDQTNFWNIYRVDLEKTDNNGYAPIHNIYPVNAEIGFPHWVLGDRQFATNGRNFVLNVNGTLKYGTGETTRVWRTISTPGYCVFGNMTMTDDDVVYCTARGPTKDSTLLRIKWKGTKFLVAPIRESRDSAQISRLPISEPEEIQFQSDDTIVGGWFYEPKSNEFCGPERALPPVILLGHGGPTAPAWPSLDLTKQYFTSRGFAVFDVNYRGSTGFGTEFRRKIYRKCGIVDRNDMINGAKALIEMGLVDPKKVCIMGRSAGGFLLLSCLLHSDVFSAAVSQAGVADLEALVQDTHKFESGYGSVMFAKYPEEIDIYKERNPKEHLDRLNVPTAFIHGVKDPVVPVSQSVELFERLKSKGVTTGLMLFENERHGFRDANSVRRAVEGSYYFLCKALGIQPNIESDMEVHNLHEKK